MPIIPDMLECIIPSTKWRQKFASKLDKLSNEKLLSSTCI